MFYPFTLIRINSLPPQPEKDLHAKGLLLGLGRASKSKLQALSDEDQFKLTEVLTRGCFGIGSPVSPRGVIGTGKAFSDEVTACEVDEGFT